MRQLFFLLLILLVSIPAFATIHYVAKDGSGDFTTPQAAVNASTAGDTVVVDGTQGPWSMSGGTVTLDRRINLFGQGWGCNGIPPCEFSNGDLVVQNAADGSVIKGTYWWDSSDDNGQVVLIQSSATGVVFQNCRFVAPGNEYQDDNAVTINGGAQAEFRDCILEGRSACIYINGANAAVTAFNTVFCNTSSGVDPYDATSLVSLTSCAFLNISAPIPNQTGNWQIDHCVFYDNSTWNGQILGPVLASYNAIEATAFPNFPGTNKINLNGLNPFVSYDPTPGFVVCTSDIHLNPVNGATLINSGDPNAALDRDGTRRDLGVFGGPNPFVDTGAPDFPFVTQFFVPVSIPQNGVLEIRSTGRVGQGGGQ
jgi:hypothetical protein